MRQKDNIPQKFDVVNTCSKYIYIYIFGAQYIIIKNREKGTYYVFRTPRKFNKK